MIKILRKYEEDGLLVTEYTKDGITVSNVVKIAISQEPTKPTEPQPTLEDRMQQLQQMQQTDSTVMLLAITDLYAEIQSLKGGDK